MAREVTEQFQVRGRQSGLQDKSALLLQQSNALVHCPRVVFGDLTVCGRFVLGFARQTHHLVRRLSSYSAILVEAQPKREHARRSAHINIDCVVQGILPVQFSSIGEAFHGVVHLDIHNPHNHHIALLKTHMTRVSRVTQSLEGVGGR